MQWRELLVPIAQGKALRRLHQRFHTVGILLDLHGSSPGVTLTRGLLPQIPSAGLAIGLVDLLELGIDDALIALRSRTGTAARLRRRAGHRLSDPHRNLRQAFGGLLDALDVLALRGILDRRDGLLDFALHVRRDTIFGLLEALLDRIDGRICLVARFHQFPAPPVLLGVGFRLSHHALDVSLSQATRRLDTDALLFAAGLVFGRDIDDSVRIDVEGHLDLWRPARRRWNANEVELTEQLVIGRHLTLALEYADGDGGLIVIGRREDLATLGGDRGVALDELGHHTAKRLDAERQRRHVEQQHVLDVTL